MFYLLRMNFCIQARQRQMISICLDEDCKKSVSRKTCGHDCLKAFKIAEIKTNFLSLAFDTDSFL